MEHFCGAVQSALRSRVKPWSNLNKQNLQVAYLSQLSVKYDLDEELSLAGSANANASGLTRTEFTHIDCM